MFSIYKLPKGEDPSDMVERLLIKESISQFQHILKICLIQIFLALSGNTETGKIENFNKDS